MSVLFCIMVGVGLRGNGLHRSTYQVHCGDGIQTGEGPYSLRLMYVQNFKSFKTQIKRRDSIFCLEIGNKGKGIGLISEERKLSAGSLVMSLRIEI